jgi:hypothetical protein
MSKEIRMIQAFFALLILLSSLSGVTFARREVETRKVPPLVEVRADGRLRFNFHHGQSAAWFATERIVAIVAGTQSGKTTFGPVWLWREMKLKGAGVYLVAAPTDPLLQVKLIPAFKQLFVDQLGLGVFTDSPRPLFKLSKEGEKRLFGSEQSEETIVYFGYAARPETLESMTAKAAWCDEAGQRQFKVDSWEAIMRRLSLAEGRVLITSTPYTVSHWLKRRVFDKRNDPRESIKVIQFKSIMNPAFPKSEYRRAKRELPRWKFRMMYCGDFSKPAGQIYDVFNEGGHVHTIPRFAIPDRWNRYGGLDFGGVNTYAVYVAEDPHSKALYAYRTYTGGNRTAKQHVERILTGEPKVPVFFGGAKSENNYRLEYKAAGLPVKEPILSGADSVELGIDRVYAELASDLFFIFDDLEDYIDEYESYTREVDEEGNVSEEIVDKNKYHGLDATRYIIGSIRAGKKRSGYTATVPKSVDVETVSRRRGAQYDTR